MRFIPRMFAALLVGAAMTSAAAAQPQSASAPADGTAEQHLAAAARALKEVQSRDARIAELRRHFTALERTYKENTTPATSTTSSHDPTTIQREPEAQSEWGTHYAKIDYLMAELFASHTAAVGTSGTSTKARPRQPLDARTRERLQEFRKHLEAFSATAKPGRPLAKPGDAGAMGALGAKGAEGAGRATGADLPPQTTTGAGAWETSRATGAPQATSPTGIAQIARPDTGTPQPGTSAVPAAPPVAHLQKIRDLVEQALRAGDGQPQIARDQPGQPPTGLPAGTSGTGTAAAETAEAIGAAGKAGGTVTISRAALEEIRLRLVELERLLAPK
jgi:hypothetical protein